MSSTVRFLDLPLEIIHTILSLLSPVELVTCQLVNKLLNAIISESSVLQYIIALALASAEDNPCSLVTLPEKLEDIRSSEVAWAALQPKFIASLFVKHRTSGIYDLSAGTYLLGHDDRMALQYLRLPTRVDDPLDWKTITVDKPIIDMGFCVFENDLIAIVTSAANTASQGLFDIEMMLLEYSTGRPHPRAKNSSIFIMSSPVRPSLMCEIVGDNLVLILNIRHVMHGGDRIFIWNWCTNVLKTAFFAPYDTYSGILFLEEDLIILPNAKSAEFDFFRIPKRPIADTLKPFLSLRLPSLVEGVGIQITCRAEPNPIADISRLNKKRRAQERADAGMDEMDPFAPKRGFLASAEDAVCIFQIRFSEGFVIGRSYTLFIHRSSFLKLAHQYEEILNNDVDAGIASGPRRIAWTDWGPPVSRWFSANGTPTRWITTSAGQRCAMIHEDGSPITILDFNTSNIQKAKVKLKKENETAKERLIQELKAMVHQSELPQKMPMSNSDDEEDTPLASRIGERMCTLQAQTEAVSGQGIFVAHEPEETSFFMGEMDVVEDDGHESWVTMADDIIGQVPADFYSDNSIPGLDSDDEPHTPSAGYTTNPQDHRHPGCAICHVFDAPSSVESLGTFAEEVEGRLPYVTYLSEREYEYDGVLLDEERILGIMTDAIDRIAAIDIFYFG